MLTELAKEMKDTGQLQPSIKKGKIVLIPKTGSSITISNYRRITLLNSVYKIQAKLLASRLKPMLPDLIRPSQTGFVPGRSILDNIFSAEEAMEWAVESGQDLALIFLDYEKAFDMVNWSFLQSVMMKMGFSDTFISWTASLYQGLESAIIVNGESSPAFSLGRAVRQGCPLAPYLYLMVADVLGHMLQDPMHGIQGLRLPDGNHCLEMLFADDTTLYLSGTKQNLDAAIRVINLYCSAFGSKVNWSKTYIIWSSGTNVHGAGART